MTVTPGSDLLDTAETRATGHVDFTKFGLHVWTESNTSTDKAAGYVAVDYPLTEVGDPSLEWLYNEPLHLMKPGLQIVIDKDNDGDYRRHPRRRAVGLRRRLVERLRRSHRLRAELPVRLRQHQLRHPRRVADRRTQRPR